MIGRYFPNDRVKSVFDVDYAKLRSMGYKGLIFDIDNTLVHHGGPSNDEVDALFERLAQIGFDFILVSDNSPERVETFNKNIGAEFIALAGKPAPDCYKKAVSMMGLDKKEVVSLGDRLTMDTLGANRAGIKNILVDFIRLPGEKKIGSRRRLEKIILALWKLSPSYRNRLRVSISEKKKRPSFPERVKKYLKGEINFSDLGGAFYRMSTNLHILKRKIKDLKVRGSFAVTKTDRDLPVLLSSYSQGTIKRGKDIDPVLQQNKAVNIDLASKALDRLLIRPGETFSFWRTIGPTKRRRGYKAGRVIIAGKIQPGYGGGLCNLGNSMHVAALHTPLTVTEVHYHSDSLSPHHGPPQPMSSGTSVGYNYIDLRLKNNTDQTFEIKARVEGELSIIEILAERETGFTYDLVEEGEYFEKVGEKYYHRSKIYREVRDQKSGELVARDLVRDNKSEVMYDPEEIPKELLV